LLAYYQERDGILYAAKIVVLSEKHQRLELVIFITIDTSIEFIALHFDGDRTVPIITGLDDWQLGIGKRPPYIIPPYCVPSFNNRWVWKYTSPHHIKRDSRITIGVDYLAPEPFVGYLYVEMGTLYRDQGSRLTFIVPVTKAEPPNRLN
jgi:hypothetical protein